MRSAIACGCSPDVGALTLFADEAEEFDRPGAGGAEPVRGSGVELHGFAGPEDQVMFTEDEAQGAVEDIGPVVAVVGAQLRLLSIPPRGEDELVGLNTAWPARERQDRRPVCTGDGSQIEPGVAGRRCIDEFVEGYPVHAGQWKELLEAGMR